MTTQQHAVSLPAKKGVRFSRLAKGALDRVGAACGLLALSPLFLVLAYRVRKDGGPAFYFQRRVGQHGRLFKCWKFRSMIVGAEQILQDLLEKDPALREEWERDFKLKNDPRITKVGAFLRKTSLDELPQLLNVLRGEMSLVGPRPITEKEMSYYGARVADYLEMKPGMTGLWQVSGRNDTTYAERVDMDSAYARTQTFWGDVVIILKTVMVMLTRRGAY